MRGIVPFAASVRFRRSLMMRMERYTWDSVEMNVHGMLMAHKYMEVALECRMTLEKNPDDIVAVEGLAKALRAKGEYTESLSFFERLAVLRHKDKTASAVAPGSLPWQIDIACLYWILGNQQKAIQFMCDLAAGVLDGSVKYGDAAGGMSQGLLLYYMGVTAKKLEESSFALDYLRNRTNRNTNRAWPFAVAQYYLERASFEDVMDAVDRQILPFGTVPPAKSALGRRRRLVVALFHDGVKRRVRGEEEQCLIRMRECREIENPLLEQEWYLARHEMESGGG
jgi:tetratricopeptide (TPR) repeat protein